MNAQPLLAAALLLGCMAPSQSDSLLSRNPAADILPPATRELVVPGTAEEDPSLLDLLREFTDCTGQKPLMDEEAHRSLAEVSVPLLAGTVVPQAEVYPFVESILVHHGVYIAPVKGGRVPMLCVFHTSAGRGAPGRFMAWAKVLPEDLPAMEDHPALLVESYLYLPNLEVRQLSTSMRTMLSDQRTQMMIPVADHGVLVRGSGRELSRMASFLHLVDESHASRMPSGVETVETPPGQGRR